MLYITVDRSEQLTLNQKIGLQKKLVEILTKKYAENPTLSNANDLKNELRILKKYGPKINV
mgnify:CR=1 FL=1